MKYLCCDGDNHYGYGATLKEAYEDFTNNVDSDLQIEDLNFYEVPDKPLNVEVQLVVARAPVRK